MSGDIEIFVLGPLTVRRNGSEVRLGGRQSKLVFGTLLVSVNHAVSLDRLAWAVWGESPPVSAENSIQSYISRLRHLLGAESIEVLDHSYALQASCDQIDSCRFERLVATARESLGGDIEGALEQSRDALRMWRGEAFGDLAYEEFAQLEALRLSELRLTAVEIETEAEIGLGKGSEAIARLQGLTVEYPHRDRFWHLLIRALGRGDRLLEAGDVYDRYCRLLLQSGLEPHQGFDELVNA